MTDLGAANMSQLLQPISNVENHCRLLIGTATAKIAAKQQAIEVGLRLGHGAHHEP